MDFDKRVSVYQEFIESKYLAELLENVRRGRAWLLLDYRKLARWSPELADDLLDDPDESLKAAEVACESLQLEDPVGVRVRIRNLPKSSKVRIRDIRSEHIDKLIVVEGALRSKTDVRPQATSAKFECPSCGNVISVLQLESKFTEPSKCGCGRKGRFRLLSKELLDVQFLTVEEDVSEIGEDTNPKRLRVLLKADLTRPDLDQELVPPASLRLIGQIKEAPIVLRNGGKSTKSDLFFEANSFEPIEDNLRRIVFTKDDVKRFKELSESPGLLWRLKESVAPHLYGMDLIKEAVLLFVVKGVKKESADKTIKCRDFFHILLIGDPGSGKSEFGKEVKKLSFKCKRAVGKGASGVGLTVSAERDELLGERVLSAGTIPTCNGGHCVIDEVDKIDEEVQSHMLDCMEEGSITVSKSRVQGIVKAEVGIFTIANPKYGRFVLEDSLQKQITLIPPLISRYDLIIPVIDEQNEKQDKALVEAIFSKHTDISAVATRPIDYGTIRKYLCYVSMNIRPKITKESLDVVRKFVLDLRKNGKEHGVVSITPRQIEGPLRLTEAYAKLRMSKSTSAEDARNAVKIIRFSLEKFGYNEEKGAVDVDIIETGVSSSERSAIKFVEDAIRELRSDKNPLVPIHEIFIMAKQKEISEGLVTSTIESMLEKGDASKPKNGFIKLEER